MKRPRRTNGTAATAARMLAQQALIDRQRGEVTSTRARHARELAELVARQVLEDRHLEKRHRGELARLWISHGRKVGRWIHGVLEDHQAAAAALDPEGR
jgi:hypothetical protein